MGIFAAVWVGEVSWFVGFFDNAVDIESGELVTEGDCPFFALDFADPAFPGFGSVEAEGCGWFFEGYDGIPVLHVGDCRLCLAEIKEQDVVLRYGPGVQ